VQQTPFARAIAASFHEHISHHLVVVNLFCIGCFGWPAKDGAIVAELGEHQPNMRSNGLKGVFGHGQSCLT
jgi:hypothetical protein